MASKQTINDKLAEGIISTLVEQEHIKCKDSSQFIRQMAEGKIKEADWLQWLSLGSETALLKEDEIK